MTQIPAKDVESIGRQLQYELQDKIWDWFIKRFWFGAVLVALFTVAVGAFSLIGIENVVEEIIEEDIEGKLQEVQGIINKGTLAVSRADDATEKAITAADLAERKVVEIRNELAATQQLLTGYREKLDVLEEQADAARNRLNELAEEIESAHAGQSAFHVFVWRSGGDTERLEERILGEIRSLRIAASPSEGTFEDLRKNFEDDFRSIRRGTIVLIASSEPDEALRERIERVRNALASFGEVTVVKGEDYSQSELVVVVKP